MTAKEYEARLKELEDQIKAWAETSPDPLLDDRIIALEKKRHKLTREMDEHAERLQMVKCMEYIARQVNDETVFINWLIKGIADGDIEKWYDPTVHESDEETLDYYTEPGTFADLMDTFLRLMTRARKHGGLYCGGIVSNSQEDDPENTFFGSVKWMNADIRSALRNHGIPATDENVRLVRYRLEDGHSLTDRQIGAGWEVFDNMIDELDVTGQLEHETEKV